MRGSDAKSSIRLKERSSETSEDSLSRGGGGNVTKLVQEKALQSFGVGQVDF